MQGTVNIDIGDMDMPRTGGTREGCSKGGRNVPAEKRSFSTNRELASSAGRKGGSALRPESRSFSTNRELAREAGRKGGAASAAALAKRMSKANG